MSDLVTLRFPVAWESFGFPVIPSMRATSLVEGADPGWAWSATPPSFGIPAIDPVAGEEVDGWEVDHVVLLVNDMGRAHETMAAVGHSPRLAMKVRGRPTSFFRVGPLLEVTESPVRAPALYGVALATDEPLEVLALRWRSLGFDVSAPKPAIQPGRRILTVRGLDAGLAVMSNQYPAPRSP